MSTSKNHSATHLLQKALRIVLGTHVEQAGSYVDAGRLRFDFSHFSAMTPEEIKRTEDIVNEQIAAGLEVRTDVMGIEEAGLVKYFNNVESELHKASQAAKSEPSQLFKKIQSMQEEIKSLHSENEKLKAKLASEAATDADSQIQEINGVKLLAMAVPGVDMNGLRTLGDQMKAKVGEGVVVLASEAEGKVSLLAMATDGAMAKGAHAGSLIKGIAALVGGGGGGRPNMAQAGGKNPAGIPDAIAKAAEILKEQIS